MLKHLHGGFSIRAILALTAPQVFFFFFFKNRSRSNQEIGQCAGFMGVLPGSPLLPSVLLSADLIPAAERPRSWTCKTGVLVCFPHPITSARSPDTAFTPAMTCAIRPHM